MTQVLPIPHHPKMNIHLKERTRPPRNHEDDLRDMEIDSPKFEGALNLDHYLEWIQPFERFFDIQEYSNKKAFNVLKLKKYASLWYENTKR